MNTGVYYKNINKYLVVMNHLCIFFINKINRLFSNLNKINKINLK